MPKPESAPAPEAAAVVQSTKIVKIACKLPHGLIMELITPVDKDSRQLLPMPAGQRYTLAGSNSKLDLSQMRSGIGPKAQATHQFSITQVPEPFAIEWFKRNADLLCVRNRLVFILENEPVAEIRKIENDPQTRTGVEALAEKNDPRLKAAGAVAPDSDSMRENFGDRTAA